MATKKVSKPKAKPVMKTTEAKKKKSGGGKKC
jgi:hypothetical protein